MWKIPNFLCSSLLWAEYIQKVLQEFKIGSFVIACNLQYLLSSGSKSSTNIWYTGKVCLDAEDGRWYQGEGCMYAKVWQWERGIERNSIENWRKSKLLDADIRWGVGRDEDTKIGRGGILKESGAWRNLDLLPRESRTGLKQERSTSGLHGGQICLTALWLMDCSEAGRPARSLQQGKENGWGHGNTDIPVLPQHSICFHEEAATPWDYAYQAGSYICSVLPLLLQAPLLMLTWEAM